MMQLLDEILEEILCRLSVKCLFRYKCVSKSWLALISSPYFVKLHLKRSIQTKRNLSLYLLNHLHCQEVFDFFQPVKVNYIPLMFQNYGLVPRGSYDGLLCMAKLGDVDNVFVWNPSIRKSIKLPYESRIDFPNKKHTVWICDYRIGYDNTNEDYKVVRIGGLQGRKGIIDYEIKVYSLRSNSWHKIEKFSHFPNLNSFGDSVAGGALHWITSTENLIVAFDLGIEKYRVLPQPEYRDSYYYLYLDNLCGCLSLTCRYISSSTVDVFLLKEYGRKNEHWSRLITLSHPISSKIFNPTKPTVQKSPEEIMIYVVVGSMDLHICLESLVDVPACTLSMID
ncbi:F-box protein CPR1-like [Impatiens glandulifera]|uniref:F-box protein CPR1-like n=1 Tax=Impatiens glandulifera TaxID=253017 RepID=UPI001FB137F5|nr:F-box protein CPR1-like [Impatiens glandulifera]